MGILDGIVQTLRKLFVDTKSEMMLMDEQRLIERLENVFNTEYADCEVRKDVSASEIEISSIAVDYSYGLYRDGKPIAFFNVIKNRNDYRVRAYKEAKAIATRHGIPHMNFFIHLPNEEEYISQRLKKEIFG